MKVRVPLLSMAFLALPEVASACTVCMGDVNSKSAGAVNAAIFLMLGFIGSLLASLAAFAFYLSRRATAPTPPHAEFGSSVGGVDDTDDLI
jgi:hypothetical protein